MKPIMYANLHNHTTHSDGVFTPEELVRVAKDEGYGAVAAADHDTVTANSKVKAECEKQGMETVFGCEFYAMCEKYKEHLDDYHLVGFDFDPEHPVMKEYLRKRSAAMTEITEFLFESAQKDGRLPLGITWQEVLDYNEGISWLCNDHVFMAMEAKGIVTDKEWPHYFKTCFAASYQKSIGLKPKYPIMQIDELISLIHDAGGIAVVAHPAGQIRIRTIPDLVKWGLDGLEVWHNSLLKNGYIHEALRLALEYDLYISGGEDHSGLCGGQYKFFDNPRETRHWAEPMSLGTTKEFFEEIKTKKKLSNRAEIIKSYMEEYPVKEIPELSI